MRTLFFISVLAITLAASPAIAGQNVNDFISEKREKAAKVRNISNNKIALYKSLSAQGKPIVADISYTSRRQQKTPLSDIQTASGASEASDGSAEAAPLSFSPASSTR